MAVAISKIKGHAGAKYALHPTLIRAILALNKSLSNDLSLGNAVVSERCQWASDDNSMTYTFWDVMGRGQKTHSVVVCFEARKANWALTSLKKFVTSEDKIGEDLNLPDEEKKHSEISCYSLKKQKGVEVVLTPMRLIQETRASYDIHRSFSLAIILCDRLSLLDFWSSTVIATVEENARMEYSFKFKDETIVIRFEGSSGFYDPTNISIKKRFTDGQVEEVKLPE